MKHQESLQTLGSRYQAPEMRTITSGIAIEFIR
jgi:hypothetical protein